MWAIWLRMVGCQVRPGLARECLHRDLHKSSCPLLLLLLGAARYQKQASSKRVSYANFTCEWYHRTSGLGQESPPLRPVPS